MSIVLRDYILHNQSCTFDNLLHHYFTIHFQIAFGMVFTKVSAGRIEGSFSLFFQDTLRLFRQTLNDIYLRIKKQVNAPIGYEISTNDNIVYFSFFNGYLS